MSTFWEKTIRRMYYYCQPTCQSVNTTFNVNEYQSQIDKMYKTYAFGKKSKDANFERMSIERNVEGDEDVTFDLKYCGVCHSDVHVADNDMGVTHYPCVPGHELAGVVVSVGGAVTRIKVGDRVGVGCLVDSCRECLLCEGGEENFCDKSRNLTKGRELALSSP